MPAAIRHWLHKGQRTVVLWQGDCRDVLRSLDDGSIDACVTDPPYHLTTGKKGGHGVASVNLNTPHGRARITTGFMGQEWDGGDVAFRPETWAEVLRVLKPGAWLLAFGGTRTHHRLVRAIEDAGFEVRDMLAWLYGSGFPKGTDKAKIPEAWRGWNTALKPAIEPICLARKPMQGTLAENLQRYGTGALWIDGCRIGMDGEDRPLLVTDAKPGADGAVYGAGIGNGSRAAGTTTLGRWPANVLHDGSEEVLAAFPDAPGQQADASATAPSPRTSNVYGAMRRGRGDEPSANSDNKGAVGFKMKPGARRLDEGSAARFFYCAKASRKDRNEGCEGNHHPTVKPTDLMRYLCRLVTPPGGVVLDPFMGSGSTLKAAGLEGFNAIGIELSAEYIEIAERRIAAGAGMVNLA